jgi:hypothetical protein
MSARYIAFTTSSPKASLVSLRIFIASAISFARSSSLAAAALFARLRGLSEVPETVPHNRRAPLRTTMVYDSITSGAPSAGSSNGSVLIFSASLSTSTAHGGSIDGSGISSIADGVSPQSGSKGLSSASTRETNAHSGSMGAGSFLEGLSVGSQSGSKELPSLLWPQSHRPHRQGPKANRPGHIRSPVHGLAQRLPTADQSSSVRPHYRPDSRRPPGGLDWRRRITRRALVVYPRWIDWRWAARRRSPVRTSCHSTSTPATMIDRFERDHPTNPLNRRRGAARHGAPCGLTVLNCYRFMATSLLVH